MKKAIINVTKHNTDSWENTEVRLFGLLVFKKHETFPDNKPKNIGFEAVPNADRELSREYDD